MTERSRNIIVGLTAVIGLILLATMIVIFAGLPEMFRSGYTVTMHFEESHGIQPGDSIHMLGQVIGTVTDVGYRDNNPLAGVTIKGRIDSDVRLPTNVAPQVMSRGFTGRGYLAMVPEGSLRTDPETGETVEFYRPGESIVLSPRPQAAEGGGGLLPKELTDQLMSLGELAKSLKELIDPAPAPDQPRDPDAPPPGLKGTVARMNRTLDAIYAITGDEDNQANLKDTLRNFSSMSENADELVRKLITDAEGISKLVLELQQTVAKMNEGEGTMGQLLNDPALYRNLVNLTRQLEAMATEAQRLLDKWRNEGMKVKM